MSKGHEKDVGTGPETVAWMRPSEEGYDSAFRDNSTVVTCTGNDWAGWVPLCRTADAKSEVEQLRLAEEGAKEAFGHVVQQKRDLEAECIRLQGLLDGAYETIRRNAATHNAE